MSTIYARKHRVNITVLCIACIAVFFLAVWKLHGEEEYRIEQVNGAFGTEEIIVLRDNPRLSLRLYRNPSYKLDILLDDLTIHRNINIGNIDRDLLSVSYLMEVAGRRVDWGHLLPKNSGQRARGYSTAEQLINQLRVLLPTLPDAEDGATDEYGRLVKIETGAIINDGGGFNCSGFSKWVIDGLLFPISKRYLTISQLKQRQLSQRGNSISARYEQEEDHYFGLDWSRALAKFYYQARYDVDLKDAARAVDVRSVPYFSYIDDVGYSVNDLSAILYLLAIKEPNSFYVGSLNKDFGTSPRLRKHFHIVLLFPYFDANGELKIVVFERNRETDFTEFVDRNRGTDIHLVRATSSASFTPPRISL